MHFYWSLQRLPELQKRSRKESRQAVCQVGLKPLRHWEVWAAILITSLLMLWGLETLAGNILWVPTLSNSNLGVVLFLAGALAITTLSTLVYQHFYLQALRPYVRQVSFDTTGGWWSTLAKSAVIKMVAPILIVLGMGAIDWVINSFDERPDPRIAALQNWPDPIPENNNGSFAAIGLQVSSGTSPHDAGRHWVAAVNEAIIKHSHAYPTYPAGLKFAGYIPKFQADNGSTKHAKLDPNTQFCNIGTQSCWNVVRQERSNVQAWLAANRELLARYQSLQKYPQWQFAVQPGDESTPIPPYQGLIRGQSLLLASAMLAIDEKQVNKGLDILTNDIHFVKTFLAAKESLIGKMIASAMLSRDLALLAEMIQEQPNELKPHWAQIEKMLEPLESSHVSIENAFRFEERWIVSSIGQDAFAQSVVESPAISATWLSHRHKNNASANMMIEFWEKVIKRTEVGNVSFTPAITDGNSLALFGFSRWVGFMHNPQGKLLIFMGLPNYSNYSNSLVDLNALNNLVRLRLALSEKGVLEKDVPAFLSESGADKSLWNPETGKPFEWDAERKQIYFVPATDVFKKRYSLNSVYSAGRVGIAVK